MKMTAPIVPPFTPLKKKKLIRSGIISADEPRRTKTPKVRVVEPQAAPLPEAKQKEALDRVMGDAPRPLL
jgi:hypothetical protein